MVKLWITLGALASLLLILEISALPQDISKNENRGAYTQGTRRYRGSAVYRNSPPLKNEALKTTQNNATVKVYRNRNTPQSPLTDQMKGKAIFYANPDTKPTRRRQSSLVRKAGQSLKLSQKTVNDTIQEVEEMMKANPDLPRLSRQQMIDILENITSNSSFTQSIAGVNQTSESREDYIRSLMLVMPFNTNNLSDSMIKDLYTKPPITEIITTTPSTPITTPQWRIVVDDVTKEPHIVYSKGTTITTTPEPTTGTTQKPHSSTFSYTIPRNTEKYKNKQTEFGSRQRPKINIRTTESPITTFKYKDNTVPRYRVRTTKIPPTAENTESNVPKYRIRTTQRPTTVYQYPESTLARVRAKTTKAPFIVTATSVTAKPFKRIPEQVTVPTPLLKDNTLIRADVKDLLASIGLFPLEQPGVNGSDTVTTTPKSPSDTTPPPPFPTDVKEGADKLSPEMQTLLKSFGLLENEIPSTKDTDIRQTTVQPNYSFEPAPPEPTVDIESYASFKPMPESGSLSSLSSTKSKQKMGDDMKDFLASFGLLQTDENTTPEQSSKEQEQRPRKPYYRSRGRKYNDVRYNSSRGRENKKEVNSTSMMDLSIDTDMLPDEMKGVLKTLGLASDLENPASTDNATANETADSTAHQIPTTSEPTTDTVTSKTNPPTVEETVTEKSESTTTSTLTTKRIDEGIEDDVRNNTEEIKQSTSSNKSSEKDSPNTEGHVFNPNDAVPNTEDIEHLNKLLKTVRLLANGTTPEELEFILGGDAKHLLQSDEKSNRKEKMTTLDQAKNPPDPLSYEELLYILNEAKNEVKRQQDANSTDSNGKDSTSSTSKPTTIEASESGGSPSVEDLAASFGGADDEDENSELPAPPSRPNGLYFLLDWNSFLEVGEDNSRVNLRFAPKLGDSRNFLPVTVP